MAEQFARFVQQHRELEELAALFVAALTDDAFPGDIMPTLRALARFTGKLKVHAAMEDEALYPWLCAHPDRKYRDIGERMRSSVQPIYRRFFDYEQHWTPAAVRDDPQGFALATSAILEELHQRMVREDREIYDALSSAATRSARKASASIPNSRD